MRKEGFVEVEVEKFGDEDVMVKAFNEQHLLTMEDFAASLVKMEKKKAAEEFYKTIGEAYEESTSGLRVSSQTQRKKLAEVLATRCSAEMVMTTCLVILGVL